MTAWEYVEPGGNSERVSLMRSGTMVGERGGAAVLIYVDAFIIGVLIEIVIQSQTCPREKSHATIPRSFPPERENRNPNWIQNTVLPASTSEPEIDIDIETRYRFGFG